LNPSVYYRKVEIGIVIEIEEAGAKTGSLQARGGEPGGHRSIFEAKSLVVQVQRVGLIDDVGDENVQIAVFVDIPRGDSHTRFRLPGAVEGYPEENGLVDESAIALIEPKLVCLSIVGDVEIEFPIIVPVGAHHSEPGRSRRTESRLRGNVVEPASPLIVIEHIRSPGKDLGGAVVGASVSLGALLLCIVRDVVSHIEIEIAVGVVIAERRRRRPEAAFDSPF
jgi:hypothetical protein